jgi:hypothetical protein
MGGACGGNAGKKCVQKFYGEACKTDHLEDIGEDETIILKCILNKYNGGA